MYNSQYYTCEQIDQRLFQGYLDDYNSQNNTNLTKEQFLTLLFNTIGRNSTVDNLVTQIGYYECDTAGSTAAKAITVANYALFAGGSLKVKFINKNTANNATLNINSQGAKALYYQGERASATNSWDAEEVVEIYYDGTSYYANNVNGGSGSGVYDVSKEHPTSGPNDDGKFTLEYILNSSNVNELIPVNKREPGMTIQFVSTSDNTYVQFRLMKNQWSTSESDWRGVDEEPAAGSKNLVESGGVYKALVNISADTQIKLMSYTSQQRRGYIKHAFKQGDKLELSFGSTPTIVADSLKIRYDDGTTDFGTLSNDTTKLFTIGRDTTEVIFVLNENNISGGGDVVINARWGLCLDTWLALDELDEELTAKIAESAEEVKNSIPDSYIDEDVYADATIDEAQHIVEGITQDGTKEINIPTVFNDTVDVGGAVLSEDGLENYSELTIDEAQHIVEGITQDGKKHISDFDDETKEIIKSFVGGGSTGNVFEISMLDANFTSPVPVTVAGTKGNDNAKYEFELPLKTSWLVRFKFRITENLLNQNKAATIASLNGQTVTAKAIPLTQHVETGTYDGSDYSDNWPTVDGGIAFNGNSLNVLVQGRNLGGQAFSVKYVGSGSIVTLENNGSAIVLTVDDIATTYSFSSYNNVSELFKAMESNNDLEMQYIALDQRTCDELAKFGAVSLKDTVHTGVNGSSTITEQVDAAPFYLNYAVSDKWHQVEIFRIGDYVYSVCDGIVKSTSAGTGSNVLTLGGECGVLFKNMVVCTDGTLDTEITNGMCISSVTPYILVFECHGMADMPACDVTPATTETGMSSLNPDTMEYFFSILEKKGYRPVSVEDIAAYYACGAELPKRCYVSIFDDQRWQVCLDNNIRCVFNRHGAKPALALITDGFGTIYHNGEVVTKEQAVAICKNADFSLVSHTKQHREAYTILPSEYVGFLRGDIYDADLKYVNGSVLVYPGGWTNVYMHDVMTFLGFKIGIEIYRYNYIDNVIHNQFMLSRVNIGRIITNTGESMSPYTDYINKII